MLCRSRLAQSIRSGEAASASPAKRAKARDPPGLLPRRFPDMVRQRVSESSDGEWLTTARRRLPDRAIPPLRLHADHSQPARQEFTLNHQPPRIGAGSK